MVDRSTKDTIVELRKEGKSYRDIARELDVSKSTVYKTLKANGMVDSDRDPTRSTDPETRDPEPGSDPEIPEGNGVDELTPTRDSQEGQGAGAGGQGSGTGTGQQNGSDPSEVLKCPACETRFELEDGDPPVIPCPRCDRTLQVDDDAVVRQCGECGVYLELEDDDRGYIDCPSCDNRLVVQ